MKISYGDFLRLIQKNGCDYESMDIVCTLNFGKGLEECIDAFSRECGFRFNWMEIRPRLLRDKCNFIELNRCLAEKFVQKYAACPQTAKAAIMSQNLRVDL